MKRTNSNNATKLVVSIIILMVLLFIGSHKIIGQVAVLNKSVLHNYEIEPTMIKEFSTTLHKNTVYMKWVVESTEDDYVFFVQRSYNNVDFQTIGVKKQYGDNVQLDLMYCFSDEDVNLLSEKVYYRIVCNGSDLNRSVNSDIAVVTRKSADTPHFTSID